MKTKILIVGVLAITFIFAGNTYAVSQNSNNGAGQNNKIQQQAQTANQGEDSQVQAQNTQQTQNAAGTGEQAQNQNQEQNQEQNKQNQGQINAEQHRSAVSTFVQSLLQVADKEEGIGEQVRAIAQQQNQSADKTVQAMEKVQTRNKIKTFLIGADYKNLGALRSEIAKTQNRLEQLNRLVDSAKNEEDKTELQKQIQTLEQEQQKIESFVKDNESKFSLFGWFVKLFAK